MDIFITILSVIIYFIFIPIYLVFSIIGDLITNPTSLSTDIFSPILLTGILEIIGLIYLCKTIFNKVFKLNL